MKVKNLNGTSTNKCNCISWLAHWERYSGKKANRCLVNGCSNVHSVGGHVQKDGSFDNKWYIVPLCSICNAKRGQTLDIWDGSSLVSANVSETCGR